MADASGKLARWRVRLSELEFDVYKTVKDCRLYDTTRGTQYNHQKHLRLFPAKGMLEFIAMDILGPLPTTKTGKQFVVVITDRYKKLTRAAPVVESFCNEMAL